MSRSTIRSCLRTTGSAQRPLPLHKIGETARAPADFCAALLALDKAVKARGGLLRVTSLGRTWKSSNDAYRRYVTGKGPYAKRGGYSNHNAYRAIDIDIASLCFPVGDDKQLDVLWECTDEGGFFTPIIADPDELKDESWHFDGFGADWQHVYALLKTRKGGIDQCAMAMCLDVGCGGYGDDLARSLQAQLHRCGQDVGSIDGAIGRKTRAGLCALGLSPDITDPRLLFGLPSRAY